MLNRVRNVLYTPTIDPLDRYIQNFMEAAKATDENNQFNLLINCVSPTIHLYIGECSSYLQVLKQISKECNSKAIIADENKNEFI